MSGLWRGTQPLILASRSAARRAMLDAAGVPCEAVDSRIDERAIEEKSGAADPASVAMHLAIAKANAVSEKYPGRLVVGSDQTLALGTRRLSKAPDLATAKENLRLMSGRTHELHAAFALVSDGTLRACDTQTARMTMRDLSDEFIDDYLAAAGEGVLGSVGVYQVEGLGLHLFSRIDGDHFTIMGMPLLALLAALRADQVLAS